MEKGIFRFILRFSLREQIMLVVLSAAVLPLLYFTLELPKIIVNDAIGGTDFPKTVLGQQLEQVPYLLLLCFAFLVLVLLSGTLKYFASTFRYRVGDRLLRRLRYDMIERLLRFPSAELRSTSTGQVVSMVTAETSNLGYFIAEAFAVPAIAAGTLATIVLFMFVQNWMMGVAAIVLYPLQIYLIPKIQKRINELQRQEVQEMRAISQRLGELVAGASEIHGHDTAQYELADFSQRLGTVFGFRVEMSSKRYIANVLNQIFSQLTPFFFLSIGGYLVIVGQLSLGALVAVLAAYKDMYSPWKDLVDYYQKSEDARVRYEQLKEFFARNGLFDKSMIESEPGEHNFMQKPFMASNVVLEREQGHRPVDGATLALTLPTHIVILGSAGSGREEFARLLARQEFPRSGRVMVGDIDLTVMPDSVTGRRIGFVSQTTFFGSGSVGQLLIYPLLRRPRQEAGSDGHLTPALVKQMAESQRAGNSLYHLSADWVDYESAGCRNLFELRIRMVEVLRLVELDQVVYEFGLRRTIDPENQAELASKLIEARRMFHRRAEASGKDQLVSGFAANLYNSHATIGENIVFGTPIGAGFNTAQLLSDGYLKEVLDQVGLTEELLQMGRRLALISSEIFRGLAPGHDFFERFSFIRSDDLPIFEAILRRIEFKGMAGLSQDDRDRLMALPFKLVEAQDNEGLITAETKDRLLQARHAFARKLPEHLRSRIQFFAPDSYSASSSIVDNILFGKEASSKAGSSTQIGAIIAEVLEELGLRDDIILSGLESDAGSGGSRLSTMERQKLALARCLLKRPEILILNEALSSLEYAAQDRMLANIRKEMSGRSLILFEPHEDRQREFEDILVMDRGRIVQNRDTDASSSDGDTAAAEADVGGEDGNQAQGLNEIVSVLKSIPLFAAIDRSKLKLLAFTGERVHFEAGQEVFHQGDAGDHAYVIIKGEAEVVLVSGESSRTLAKLGQNQFFGEMALLSSMPRTTTIRAVTPLVLLRFSQDVFMRMVEENSEIAVAMLRVLSERLAATLRDYGKVVNSTSGPDAQRAEK
jgi:ABC-type bacteriocin/lantibiotic exporter with double-glycine peptidase domain